MLASELFERLDMFLIVAIASVTESGYYFVAVPAAQLLIVAPNALGVFTFNAGADRGRKVSLKQAVTVMSLTALLQVVSAIVFAFLIPLLIILFYKSPYAPAIPFALWLLPACAIKGYLQAVDGYLKGRGKPMIGVRARVLSIFVMLAFVGGVYGGIIVGPSQKLLCIPMAACLGQAISMLIISAAVIRDTIEQDQDSGLKTAEANHDRS
jgi:O-antigen/teichoic acid export membrane protein